MDQYPTWRDRLALRRRDDRGLSLIDLLIGIAIMGLLMVISFSTLGTLKRKAELAETSTNAGRPEIKPDVPEPVAPVAPADNSWILTVLGVLLAILLVGAIIAGVVMMAKRTARGRASAGLLAARWDTMYAKFDEVRLEWGGLNADPLSILEHSRLLDVSFPKTAAFLDSFHRLQDRINVLQSSKAKLDAVQVNELEELTATVARTWTDAKVAAERASYNWLPEAERGYASTAANLLRLASNEAATVSERAQAAERAAKMLRRIEHFAFPTPTMTALEAGTYLALEASPTA